MLKYACLTTLAGLMAAACSSPTGAQSSASVTVSGGFTGAQVVKAWTSGCTAGAEPISGADHYVLTLNLQSATYFTSQTEWYSGSCTSANSEVLYSSTGTYSVGGYVNGSTTLTAINFLK